VAMADGLLMLGLLGSDQHSHQAQHRRQQQG
jgi:hypothetical protein